MNRYLSVFPLITGAYSGGGGGGMTTKALTRPTLRFFLILVPYINEKKRGKSGKKMGEKRSLMGKRLNSPKCDLFSITFMRTHLAWSHLGEPSYFHCKKNSKLFLQSSKEPTNKIRCLCGH